MPPITAFFYPYELVLMGIFATIFVSWVLHVCVEEVIMRVLRDNAGES